MKKLIIPIIIVVVIIVVIIISLIVLKLGNNNDNNIQYSNTYEQNLEEDAKNTVTPQQEKELIYNVEQCVDSYLDIINTNSSIYYSYDENNNYQKVVNENEIILNILSTEYISENNITVDNIDNYIEKLDQDVFFIPLQTKYVKNGYMYKYVINGYITDFNYNIIQNISLIVNLDITNYTYSIEPLENANVNIEDVQLNNTLETIEKNDNNTFQYISTIAEEEAERYLDTYKKMLLSNPEEAYNRLDEEYRNKRFGSLDEFEKYINNNRQDFLALQPTSYLLNTYDEYNEYVCRDKYQNLYIFRANNPLDYRVLLDTYTIITDNFKTTYDKSNNEYKVAMNIDKWVQMLNARDYKTAYNCLDETFRNNNFGSEEAFEQYMRENFPLRYELEFGQTTENNGIYQQEIILTDITGASSDQINKTIIMQLGENYEFVMSFNIE